MTRRSFFALLGAATVAPVRAAFANPRELAGFPVYIRARDAYLAKWVTSHGEWVGLAS